MYLRITYSMLAIRIFIIWLSLASATHVILRM
nr:MAG TPA: hypothetical protein [Caudoviricetes sp.]